MRVTYDRNPFPPAALPGCPQPPPGYGCQWIWHPSAEPGKPAFMAFRLPVSLDRAHGTVIHVSADQRYELYLDGKRIGRGPMRGDVAHWQYESYHVDLMAGSHLLAARVWWLPEDGAPMAQLSSNPGFLLLAEGPLTDRLSTGVAPWEVLAIEGYERLPAPSLGSYAVVGWSFLLDGHQHPWGWNTDPCTSGAWQPAVDVAVPVGDAVHAAADPETAHRQPAHHLEPTALPAMCDLAHKAGTVRLAESVSSDWQPGSPVELADNEIALASQWQAMLRGDGSLEIEQRRRVHVLIDLDDYLCAYPELSTSGGKGARITMGWAEALYESADPHDHRKGNRGEVQGKYIRCPVDAFLLEGGRGRLYSTLWWRAGRYVDVLVETEDDPLSIHGLIWRETRYPLEMESTLETDDAAFDAVRPLMFRTLQMCAHETYMDCPYYEQLQYVGDTRLEILATFVTTHDDRLPVRAYTLFDQSRGSDGLTRSRYPSAVPQVIPPFSLWWVSMVHDLYMWRRRHELVRRMLPGVHAVLSAFDQYRGAQDLVSAPDSWNFVDWVPEWRAGCPPDARYGHSSILNLQFIYALDRACAMLEGLGNPDLARHWRRIRERVAAAVVDKYWVARRGLLSDDLAMTRYSEHAQCLALLCDLFDGSDRNRVVEGMLHSPGLARTTVYFSHYLFEALYKVGALDQADQRLSFWRDLPSMGLKTVLEQPEPSRSDCHAWGAHPLYHAYASFLGARPSEPGFARIRIAPQPGRFRLLRGRMPDAGAGWIAFDLSFVSGMSGSIDLPDGLEGELVWQGQTVPLKPGHNALQPAR